MTPTTLTSDIRTAGHRLSRLRRAAAIKRMYHDIVSTWDQAEFTRRFRAQWDPFPTAEPRKYLVLDIWLKEAVARYLTLGLFPDSAPRRVLDLGCGMGYFLQVCRHNGHLVQGLDLDDEPLYNEAVDYFGLPRTIHRIEPLEPLPDVGASFDVITSFMTCFNLGSGGASWGSEEWIYFLEDVMGRLTPRGEVAIGFNADPDTGSLYPSDLRRALRSLPGTRVRFLGEYLRLSRR